MSNIWIIGITCAFMLADIISGFIKAWHDNDLQSRAMRNGLFNKAAFLGLIGVAQLTELAADKIPEIEMDLPITSSICAYIVVTEIVSVLGNLRDINPDIGGVLNRFPAHPDDEPDDDPDDEPAEPTDAQREQAKARVRSQAEDRAEERILDALLPRRSDSAGWPQDESAQGDTRQKFRKQLREGKLEPTRHASYVRLYESAKEICLWEHKQPE